jgi:hypothetical protein
MIVMPALPVSNSQTVWVGMRFERPPAPRSTI